MLSKFSAAFMLQQRRTAMLPLRQFSAFPNHRNTSDNVEGTPFEFTPESYAAINVLLDKYPSNYKSSAVIPTLFIAQK